MGFKKINKKELQNSLASSFIGAPLNEIENILDIEEQLDLREEKEESLITITDVLVRGEEKMNYIYDNRGSLEKTSGTGTIKIINESKKDRLWDIRLSFENLHNTNLEEGKVFNLGNIDPEESKGLEYRLKNSSHAKYQPLKVEETIDLLNVNTEDLNKIAEKFKDSEQEMDKHEENQENNDADHSDKKILTKSIHLDNKRKILLYEEKNTLKYTITLENMTEDFSFSNLKVAKAFNPNFSNFKYETEHGDNLNIEMKENKVFCTIDKIEADSKVKFNIYVDIIPKERKLIGTGNLQISYLLEKDLLSRLEIDTFSAYSHAMHAISKKEKETEPNVWNCFVYFKNNCDFNMKLKSILVLDKDKKETFIDQNFENREKILSTNKTFKSDNWEIANKKEPKFFRKLEYSTTHRFEKITLSSIKIKENFFEIFDTEVQKKFSKLELKSFEKDTILNTITVKNKGTEGVDRLLIEETIPQDFLPSFERSEFQIETSSGQVDQDALKITIDPDVPDSSKPHKLSLYLKKENSNNEPLVEVEDFLRISYPILVKSPDYKKKYSFPLDISYYSSLFKKQEQSNNMHYKIKDSIDEGDLPQLNIIHERRDLLIAKEIFPGKTVDEFGINVLVKNNSNIEVTDINIKDTLPKSFEFVSSNVENSISESKNSKEYTISFKVEKIFPNQEKEIRYYVKKTEKEQGGYKELE
ncbi:MAG: hypothetical protein ACOCT9_01065, partial [archaeon]